MDSLAYILSISALVLMTIPSLLKGKNMKGILVLLGVGNGLMGVSYLLDGGINGAISSFSGFVTTFINFMFALKRKPVPKFMVLVYMLIGTGLNLYFSGGLTRGFLLVFGAGLAYQIGSTRQTGAQYRFWILFNLLLWCVYDITSASYSVLVTHATQLAINSFSMFIYDRKKQTV